MWIIWYEPEENPISKTLRPTADTGGSYRFTLLKKLHYFNHVESSTNTYAYTLPSYAFLYIPTNTIAHPSTPGSGQPKHGKLYAHRAPHIVVYNVARYVRVLSSAIRVSLVYTQRRAYFHTIRVRTSTIEGEKYYVHRKLVSYDTKARLRLSRRTLVVPALPYTSIVEKGGSFNRWDFEQAFLMSYLGLFFSSLRNLFPVPFSGRVFAFVQLFIFFHPLPYTSQFLPL